MAVEIFPTENDVGGGGKGRDITEANWENLFAHFSYVKSGIAPPGSTGTLTLALPAGTACHLGHWINVDAANVSLNASATNRVWLKFTRVGNLITTFSFVVRTDTAIETDAIMICEAETNATQSTAIYDRRRQSPFMSAGKIAAGPKSAVLGYRPNHVKIWNGTTMAIVAEKLDALNIVSGITFQAYGFDLASGGASLNYFEAFFGEYLVT